jgi:acetyl esterase
VVDGQPLLGRLHRSAGSQALVVEVHGGAWIMNDRTSNAAIHEHLARHGIGVFALDFRLAPAHRYPAAVEDVNYAIRWLKANAVRLGVPARLVGGVGTSSGAQQLVLCALQPERFAVSDPVLDGHDAGLDFVVACWPILDPLARYRMAKANGLEQLINAHHAYFADEAAMSEGNPQQVVERGEASALPPMLVLQGTGDQNVEHERADAFAAAYSAVGGEIELVKFDGEPHTFIAKSPTAPASIVALERMTRYIHARLG